MVVENNIDDDDNDDIINNVIINVDSDINNLATAIARYTKATV